MIFLIMMHTSNGLMYIVDQSKNNNHNMNSNTTRPFEIYIAQEPSLLWPSNIMLKLFHNGSRVIIIVSMWILEIMCYKYPILILLHFPSCCLMFLYFHNHRLVYIQINDSFILCALIPMAPTHLYIPLEIIMKTHRISWWDYCT